MTITNPHAYVDSLWDWGVLANCFGGTRIAPTDIDGFVERRGKFLVIETKSPGVSVPLGQRMTFNALRSKGDFTIMVVWGKPGQPEQIKVYTKDGVSRMVPCTMATFRRIVKQWYEAANAGKDVSVGEQYREH